MKAKDKAVNGLTAGIEHLFRKNKVDYMKGFGKFLSNDSLLVELEDGKKQELKAKNIIIATGSEPSSLPPGILDIDEEYIVTSTGALSLKKIPKSMIVVGAGVIGLEIGSIYNRLGTQVTVLQHLNQICPYLDT